MTREEYIKAIKALDKKQEQIWAKRRAIAEEYEKNIPFPKGTLVTVRLKNKESDTEYSVQGYVQSWHVADDGHFRPELKKLNRKKIVTSKSIYYDWHHEILSIEEWKPKGLKTCENCLWLGVFKKTGRFYCSVTIVGHYFDEDGHITGTKALPVESKEQLACDRHTESTWPKVIGKTNWERLEETVTIE